MFPVPEYAKDVEIALLGGSVAIAGLLLVVVGFVFAAAASFPSTINDSYPGRYERAGRLGLAPFALSLAEAAASLYWLAEKSDVLYSVTIWGFFLLLLLTAAYGFVLILRYL